MSQAAWADGILFTVDMQTDRLETIDTDTFVITDIGPLNVPTAFGGLAYDKNSDTLYMIDGRELNNLYIVDKTTGGTILIGNHGIGDIFGLAYDSLNDVLYATQLNTGGQGTGLFSLNVGDASATFIGNTGGLGIGGLAYDSLNDRLIGVRDFNGEIYEVDRTNGNVVLLSGGANMVDSGLAFDVDKNLFWSVDWFGNFISYDPNNAFTSTTHLTGLNQHTALTYVNFPQLVVGGEFLSIDTTALMLAGLQSSAIWMLPVLAGVAGSAFGVLYIKSRRN